MIDTKLAKHLYLDRIIGPYAEPPTNPQFRVSPLDVVSKKTPGEFRMIHEGSSVNDFIPKELSSVQYDTIYDAMDCIKHSPTPEFMAKVDIESAFRIVPLSPADRPLLGFIIRQGAQDGYSC